MTAPALALDLLEGSFSVHRLTRLPADLPTAGVLQVLRDGDEITVVATADHVLPALETSGPWRCLRVRGPLPFTAVGIIARIGAALAEVGVPVFVASGWSTDYVLVPGERVADALAGLGADGMTVFTMGRGD